MTNIRHIKQIIPVIGLYELTTTIRTNIIAARLIPILHANFFGAAPTYSGVWLPTINRAIINVGEYFGLTKTRIIKSVRKAIIVYFMSKKSPLNKINIKEKNINRKSIPAEALISLSFKTGILSLLPLLRIVLRLLIATPFL